MKTLHNLNNAIHAHDSLFVHYEPHALFIIMSLMLSSLLWASRSLHYYEPHALFFIMSLTLSSLLWASRSLHYYEPHALFFIMSLTLSSLLWASCFMLYNSNSILLFFANHAFFKYHEPINMKFSLFFFAGLQYIVRHFKSIQTFHLCIIS
jgi:hypothetical protein